MQIVFYLQVAIAGLQTAEAATAAQLVTLQTNLATLVSSLKALVGNADPARIALVAKFLETHAGNFFAIILAPKCETATEPSGCPADLVCDNNVLSSTF